MKLVDLVFARPELFQYPYIFTSSPNGINGDVELQAAVKKLWKFGERKITGIESLLYRATRCTDSFLR
jgi:hypothetical protein